MTAWWLEPKGAPALELACGGDLGLIGRLRVRGRSQGYDAVLEAPASALRDADLATLNLEFPVADTAPGHEFYHDRDVPAALFRAGVRIACLANNHMMDLGGRAVEQTLEACREADIATVGAGTTLEEARRPVMLERRGQRLGVLAYCTPGSGAASSRRPGVCAFDRERVREDLRALRPRVDWLVVHAHWGSMYVDDPPPRVLDWAALLEQEGADLVIGHHPHVLQGFERRGRMLVLYSLGDLAFDPSSGDFYAEVGRAKRRLGAVATVAFAREGAGIRFAPLAQEADFAPRLARGEEAALVLGRLRSLCETLPGARSRFASGSGPELLRYELQSLTHYLRRGRLDRVVRLLGSVRPRHLPILWGALRRGMRRDPALRA